MKRFKKMLMMGLVAAMAMSAMSVSASAKSPIYDEDGELCGYEYYASDFDMDKLKAVVEKSETYNHNARLSSSAPTSYTGAKNLASNTCTENFSLSTLASKKVMYSNAYKPTTEGMFIVFLEDSDYGDFSTELYSLSKSNVSSSRLETWIPSDTVIGRSFLRSKYTADSYYFKVSNLISGDTYAGLYVTGDSAEWESVMAANS